MVVVGGVVVVVVVLVMEEGGMSGNDVERNKLRRMRQSDVLCAKISRIFK